MAARKPKKDVADMTVAELRARASDLEITGRSSMNKPELRQAVIDAEEQLAGPQARPAPKAKRKPAEKPTPKPKPKAEAKPKKERKAKPKKEQKGDGMPPASEITAPSIGPHTVIEYVPPEERLAKHEPSETDAMGLNKRRGVTGQKYGASFAKQATVYGVFVAVVAALAIGGKLLADELDAPPETIKAEAPWSDVDAEQHPPAPIDFPRNPSP